MTKKLTIGLLVFAALLSACSDDPTTPPPPGESPKIMPLTSRSAVLNNIEVGWNKRSPDAIDKLLDDNFTFYLDPGSVGGGIPPFWDRATDLAVTTALLQSNTVAPTPPAPTCQRVVIDLDLDELAWTEVPVPASPSTAEEVWYTTVVSYGFLFEMEDDNTFIAAPSAKAQFTVREVEGGWRLVEWRDLGSGGLAKNVSCGSCAYTWGRIKAMYL